MASKDAKAIGVYGRRGSGKSHLVKHHLLKGRGRWIAFDPMREYHEAGARRVATLAELVEAIRAEPMAFRVAWDPTRDPAYGDATPQALHDLAVFVWRIQTATYERRPRRSLELTLVVEEMNLAYPAHQLKAGQRGLQRLILQGRHVGVHLIGATQRPHLVNRDFRANVAESYWFPLADPDDLAAAGKVVGKPNAERLVAMPAGEHLHVDMTGKVSHRRRL